MNYDAVMSGAIVMGCVVVGVLFLRFYVKSLDRLFAYFAVAFWLLALNYLVLEVTDRASELRPLIYVIRLAAFVLIIVAIVQKNRGRP